ncbi:MAG: hypothetical protein LBS69_04330 [Prevotellaceae bacterium]|nr:hypothetical protein [Prevotellaceae bacterium]
MINPRTINVTLENNYTLHVWFTIGEEGRLDLNPANFKTNLKFAGFGVFYYLCKKIND